MNLDQTIVNIAFSALGALAAFVLHRLRDENKARKEENAKRLDRISELHSQIAREYVRRDDFKDHSARVESMLAKIFDKLDEKADRP